MGWRAMAGGAASPARSRRRFACAALGVAGAVAALAGGAAPARAQPTEVPPITRVLLERRAIPGSDLEMQIILATFPPGAVSPLHHHPVPGLVYVVEGMAVSAYGDEAPRLYRAGETMQDLPDIPHTHFRNASTTSVLRFLIFANLRPDQPYLIAP